jgi:hypothetical protein
MFLFIFHIVLATSHTQMRLGDEIRIHFSSIIIKVGHTVSMIEGDHLTIKHGGGTPSDLNVF